MLVILMHGNYEIPDSIHIFKFVNVNGNHVNGNHVNGNHVNGNHVQAYHVYDLLYSLPIEH